MRAHRATFLLAAATCAAWSLPAAAQVEDGIVLNILRECARIEDASARLACYDNNIRSAGAQARTSVPGRMDTPAGGGEAPASPVGGFGSEDVRTARSSAPSQATEQSLSARVAQVDPLEPGIYVLTLADGARWQFTDGVDQAYKVPRNGDTVAIERAALGSYLMRFEGQQGVRIRRIR